MKAGINIFPEVVTSDEIGVLQVEKRIRGRVKRQMEKTQREYYLNEQMKAIQKELGEGEDGLDDIGELEKKIEAEKEKAETSDKTADEGKGLSVVGMDGEVKTFDSRIELEEEIKAAQARQKDAISAKEFKKVQVASVGFGRNRNLHLPSRGMKRHVFPGNRKL